MKGYFCSGIDLPYGNWTSIKKISTSFPTWNSSRQMGHSLQSVGTALSLNFGSSSMSASTASLYEKTTEPETEL
jgi:hypothetical protein